MLYLAFDYPFRQLQVGKVFGLVPERNHAARNFDLRLGFRIEYLAEGVFNHADGVNGMYLMSMTKDECKWLDMKMPYIEYASEDNIGRIIPLAQVPVHGWMN